jgi:putative SOS response-associated peptidase YedK
MCGRFALNEKADDVAAFLDAVNDFPSWEPAYSIAPTNVIPVVRERAHSDGEVTRQLEPAVWDFWPQWMSAEKKKRPQFNSRIETLDTLGLWKKAASSTRCIVPMVGYFEWTEAAGKKWPHFIHGTGLLAAAAIYTPRKDDAGEWYLTASIVTREARDASGELHDRMPAFLTPDLVSDWLNPAPLDPSHLEALIGDLVATSERVASTITTYPVDRKVNNTRTADPADPTLIAPVDAQP